MWHETRLNYIDGSILHCTLTLHDYRNNILTILNCCFFLINVVTNRFILIRRSFDVIVNIDEFLGLQKQRIQRDHFIRTLSKIPMNF